ncbi:AgmX/PglI C-terminal domain-containing protein [Pseudenhygromyxa sp. WMMC2535]|uniref:AgmX/PglI C-terminal domain-containing protein n=1 Tax=Pseudenhygromyxa sp. WMMC2535 TaxID=2712867 RepID=UPI001556187E|nr:AgmX/PglI C-terminal domain-containing protein [Pseudenhygromyxa sp. WMMC2535]NVB41743.1 AgmX/PglI C-terminal domain-containing protein [Pseudenhygromyxa sp. WMMC2535]
MATKTLRFRIFRDGQLVDTRSFDQDIIKLGRLASSHLQLDGEGVGRMHAVIEVSQAGELRLIDLGSAIGTAVNGVAVDRNTVLGDGDVLECGPFRLELSLAAPSSVAARPARPSLPSERAIATPPSAAARVDLSQVEDASEQVAEVVTSYQRSILDVSHVGQSRSRKRSALPLLGLGGVLMAGGLGLFAYEVSQPWESYSRELAEATQQHAEAPEAPGLGTGALGLGLALLGLVPFVAGSMRRREQGLDCFAIGESPAANFKVSGHGLPDPGATALVSRVPGGYALSFTDQMRGSVEIAGQRLGLDELVHSGRTQPSAGLHTYALPKGARARVDHGDVHFDVSLVNRGAVVAGRGEIDWPFWGYFGGTATIATAFYLLMRSIPDDAMAMQLDDEQAANRFASFFHQADMEPEQEEAQVEPEQVESNEASGGDTGKRAAGPEGRMGDRTAKAANKSYAMAGSPNSIPQISRTFDPSQEARTAGLLGLIAQQNGHFLASADGGAFSVGKDDQDVWGNLVGTEIGAAYGPGGLGLAGTGRQGGGTSEGLIGMGNTGLIGHGTGTNGTGFGTEGGGSVTGFTDRKKRTPVAQIGKSKVVGAIDKDTIRRIVRAHLNEVRGCYNSGLTRDPNLEGRVLVHFSIVGTGKVGSAIVQENTTHDKAVGDCIAKAVKRWKFPPTRNGGTAMVTYPFRLNAR